MTASPITAFQMQVRPIPAEVVQATEARVASHRSQRKGKLLMVLFTDREGML